MLAGLTRVRSFSQDDGHIFCAPDQIQDEVASVITMMMECYRDIGFEARVYLATRPEKYQGTIEMWDKA